MQFKQLEYLVSVAETKSMTVTGNLLYVSHQNVSKSLISLEEELGIPLFRRTSKGVTLTDEGEAILQYARQILFLKQHITDLATSMHPDKSDPKENIDILISNGFAGSMSTVQMQYERQHPKQHIFAKEMEPFSILSAIKDRSLPPVPAIFTIMEEDDLAFCMKELSSTYDISRLYTGQMILIANKSLGLDPAKVYTLKELENIPLAFFQENSKQPNLFYRALKKRNFSGTNCRFPGSPLICAGTFRNGTAAMVVQNVLFNTTVTDEVARSADRISISPKIPIISVAMVRKDATPSLRKFVEFFLHVYNSQNT